MFIKKQKSPPFRLRKKGAIIMVYSVKPVEIDHFKSATTVVFNESALIV